MIHIFTVPEETFKALQGTRRHLFVKDSAKYATEDKAVIQPEDGRDQLEFDITMIEHGPDSKHIIGHYCLIGLYAPYTATGEIKEVALPQRDGSSNIED